MTKVRGYSWISRTANLSKIANQSWVRCYIRCSIFPVPWEIYLFAIVASLRISSASRQADIK